MIKSVNDDIMEALAKRHYLIFPPLPAKDMKQVWRELNDVEAFRGLSRAELTFMWWFSNRTSPIINVPEEKRVMIAIDRSFRPMQAESRRTQWASLAFPDPIREAMRAMGSFDPGGRIVAIADDLHLLAQMQSVIRKDISGADMSEITEWMKAVAGARKIRDEILVRIERGSLGVIDTAETDIDHSLDGISADFIIHTAD